MKITEHKVEIIFKAGLIGEVGKTYEEEVYNVIGENDKYLCLDTWNFTTIEKKIRKHSIYPALEKTSIGSYINDSVWGTKISYTLFTVKKKRKSTIKKEISDYIKREFSFFMDTDLSFLD